MTVSWMDEEMFMHVCVLYILLEPNKNRQKLHIYKQLHAHGQNSEALPLDDA